MRFPKSCVVVLLLLVVALGSVASAGPCRRARAGGGCGQSMAYTVRSTTTCTMATATFVPLTPVTYAAPVAVLAPSFPVPAAAAPAAPAVPSKVLPASQAAAPVAPVVVAGDVQWFVVWLNGERQARGLAPCAVNLEMCQDAEINSRHGFGHFFMGRARRQNAGVGSLVTVCQMWVQSPGHAAALFDPTITQIGLAQVNGVYTFAAF